MPEPNISTCHDVGMWQFFVRWWCSLVVFVAGVRVVEFGSYGTRGLTTLQMLLYVLFFYFFKPILSFLTLLSFRFSFR